MSPQTIEVHGMLSAEMAERIKAEADASLPAPVDFVSLQDYEDAIELLDWVDVVDEDGDVGERYRVKAASEEGMITHVGRAWRERAIASLNDKIDRTLQDERIPTNQQQFLAKMRTLAQGYQEAAEALKV